MNIISQRLKESSAIISACESIAKDIEQAAQSLIYAFKNGKKLLIIGNGGSAADAQHVAAEFINKFNIDRNPLPAISLSTDTSNLTSISNDYGFDHVFAKQIKALGNEGDVLLVITTSDADQKKGGHSNNIWHAIIEAREKKMAIIGLLSEKSKQISAAVDLAIKIPAKQTSRIQEAQIVILHIICEIVENELFGKK